MTDKLWQYIKECIQLLHWIYFQPYTLSNKLFEICPFLTFTNPFSLHSKLMEKPELNMFVDHEKLKKYTDQTFLLLAIFPITVVICVTLISSLFIREPINFFRSGFAFFGWFLGVFLLKDRVGRWRKRLNITCFIIFAITLMLSLGTRIVPGSMDLLLLQFPILHVFSIGSILSLSAGGVILSTSSINHNIQVSIAYGTLFIMGAGITNNTALGISSGVILSSITISKNGLTSIVFIYVVLVVAISAILEVIFSLTGGVTFGVFFGIFFIAGTLRIHFWIPEFIWSLMLGVLVRQGKAAGALRLLPPYFDQLIHLPLPFMADLIIEAHGTHSTSAQSTINYLISSTNQQKAAHQAMFGIALDRLNQCRYLSDIVQAKTQLAWLPNDADTFGKVLPQLLSISQSISAATEATSPYRTLELLHTPIQNLETLRSRLVQSDLRPDAPIFGTLIDRWLQILQDSRQTLTETAAQSVEIPNRYLSGNALEPASAQGRFKGRQDLFRAIETISLSAQPPTLLLYGRRRTGKTSALKYLPQRVGGDLVPLLVDFQGASSIEKLENVAQFIADEMIRSAQIARDLQLPPIDAKTITADPFNTLRTWLETIERRIPGKRFLLCFDEFERLEEIINATGKRTPLNFFRHIMQHRPQWVLLFSGSHTLRELQPYWSDCLISTQTLKLTYLQPAEARDLILHPVPDFPDIYEPAAVDAIIHLTRCQPYLVQLVCSCLVEKINATQRKRVTLQEVDRIATTVIERAEGYFNEFWRITLNSEQQGLLSKLVRSSAIAPTLSEREQIVCKQLMQLEVLEQLSDRSYQFQVPLIQKFVELEIQIQ
jgi:uncharacterized protein